MFIYSIFIKNSRTDHTAIVEMEDYYGFDNMTRECMQLFGVTINVPLYSILK